MRQKAKPIVAKGWLCWKPQCMKFYTPSVREATEKIEQGFRVHRVEIRSVIDLTKK